MSERFNYMPSDPSKANAESSRTTWINELRHVFAVFPQQVGKATSDSWTRGLMDQIARLGIDHGFHVAASKTLSSHWGECGFDLSWRDYGRSDRVRYGSEVEGCTVVNTLRRLPLVLESEWGAPDAVRDDFEKLLTARSELRVMICEAGSKTVKDELLQSLRDTARQFAFSTPDDRYLVAIYTCYGDWTFDCTCFDGTGRDILQD